jgi:serine/threonine-protein kinase
MGLVCPRCTRRFEEGTALIRCPDDGTPLVRTADLAAAEGDPMLGRVLAGRFTILARIGAGSMGTVYRAKQAPIGREVAIKILRSDRAIDEVSRARFLREARANSLLTSPNTVTVFDFGQSENGDFYLAMELLEGESLGQRIKRLGRLEIDAAIDAARQALRSLAEAHAKGIIHRDLKPDNLFYARVRMSGPMSAAPIASSGPASTPPGGMSAPSSRRPPAIGQVVPDGASKYEESVKVLDFGIAKMLHAEGEAAMNAVETQAGTVFGTPRYMSPEQAQGKPLDARSDLYSLGVILYHMLTGRPPFTDDDAIVVMARHIKTMPRPMSEVAPDARIPSEVEACVMRVLSKEPEKRPQDAEAMIVELTRARESGPVTSGVRASLANVDVALDRHGAAPSAPPTASALVNDTLSGPAGVPLRAKRWWVAGAVLALAAVVAAILVPAAFSRTATSAIALPPSAANPPAIPPPIPPPQAASPAAPAASPAVPSPTPSVTASAASRTTPAVASGSRGPSQPIPAVPATALPRADPPSRPSRPSRPSGGSASRPAGSSSVGYGYLE